MFFCSRYPEWAVSSHYTEVNCHHFTGKHPQPTPGWAVYLYKLSSELSSRAPTAVVVLLIRTGEKFELQIDNQQIRKEIKDLNLLFRLLECSNDCEYDMFEKLCIIHVFVSTQTMMDLVLKMLMIHYLVRTFYIIITWHAVKLVLQIGPSFKKIERGRLNQW